MHLVGTISFFFFFSVSSRPGESRERAENSQQKLGEAWIGIEESKKKRKK